MGINTFPASSSGGTTLTVGKKFSGKITKPTVDPFLGNYSYGAATVNCTEFGNSTWVVIAGGGRIYTSTDGLTWNPLRNNLLAAALTNTGDGNGTTPAVTGQQIGHRSTLRATSLKFANSIWAVNISNGTVLTSPDLVTWTLRLTATQTGGSSAGFLTFGNGTWVFANSFPKVYSSTDNWVTNTDRTTAWSTGAGASNSIRRVIYANALFIAIDSGGLVTTSPDAVTWTARTGGFGGTTATDIATNSSTAGATTVIIGSSGKWAYSTNGTTWTQNTANATETHTNIIWDGSRFAIFSASTTASWYSTNGIGGVTTGATRTAIGTPVVNSQQASSDGTGKILFTVTGTFQTTTNITVSWNTAGSVTFNTATTATALSIQNPTYQSAVDGTGRIWKVSYMQDKVWTSTDNGVTWTFANAANLTRFDNSTVNSAITINGFKYLNGVLFAFTGSSTAGQALLYSTDNGTTWAKATSVIGQVRGIAYGNGVYVVVTNATLGTSSTTSMYYATTPSGTWTAVNSGSAGGATSGLFYGNADTSLDTKSIFDIEFNTLNGFFEVWTYPDSGAVIGYCRSLDGINWIEVGQTAKNTAIGALAITVTNPSTTGLSQSNDINFAVNVDGLRSQTPLIFKSNANGKQVLLSRQSTGTVSQMGLVLVSRTVTDYPVSNQYWSAPFGQVTPIAPYVNVFPVSVNNASQLEPLYLTYHENFGWLAMYFYYNGTGQQYIFLTSSNGEYWDVAATLNYSNNTTPLRFFFASNESDKLIVSIADGATGIYNNTIVLNTVISEPLKV